MLCNFLVQSSTSTSAVVLTSTSYRMSLLGEEVQDIHHLGAMIYAVRVSLVAGVLCLTDDVAKFTLVATMALLVRSRIRCSVPIRLIVVTGV